MGGLHKKITFEKKTGNLKVAPYKDFFVGTKQIEIDDLKVSKA